MCSPNIVSLSVFNNFLLPQQYKLSCNGWTLIWGRSNRQKYDGLDSDQLRGNILSPPIKESPQQDKNCCLDSTDITSLRGSRPTEREFSFFFFPHGCSAAEPAAPSTLWPQNHEFIKKRWLKSCTTQERCCHVFLQMKNWLFFSLVVLKKYRVFCRKMFFRAIVFKCLFLLALL